MIIDILKELDKLGTIVIWDKEAGDYAITTNKENEVNALLSNNDIEITDIVYNGKYDNFTFDFRL